jgi:L-lactate dehydrogenase complex protein LldG
VDQQFLDKFASLSGESHRARDLVEAGEIVARIVREAEATCIATADVPAGLDDALATLETQGVTVHRPPYSTDDVLDRIDAAQIGLSMAEFAIAETGTLVEITTNDDDRLISSLPHTHICLVSKDAMVDTLMEAAPRLRTAFDAVAAGCTVSFISGPSRTGDIEMKLTLGVHGPEVAHAIVVDDMRVHS